MSNELPLDSVGHAFSEHEYTAFTLFSPQQFFSSAHRANLRAPPYNLSLERTDLQAALAKIRVAAW